jgi:membrane fusion protein, multidrug efflux system
MSKVNMHKCQNRYRFVKTSWRGARWIATMAFPVVFGGLASGCGQQTQQQAQQLAQQQGQPQGQQQGRQGQGRRQGGGQAVPVMVEKVALKTVPIEVTAIGNVEAFATVSVKAQVAGELLEAQFEQGDFVRKGQLLFKIDELPYQAALDQAKAALARDKALAVNNRIQADRYKQLLAQGVVPAQQVDSFVSAADASDAVVTSDEAAVRTAQLNLGYCTINSPIDGRTGALMVQPGNLVKASDVPIVVINQINPIYVNFTVPQNYLPDVKRYMAAGKLRAMATVPNDPGPPEQGVLAFVDNSVDSSTGTIRLRATFENSHDRLWPGLFVNVVLRLSEQPNSTVVSAQAITTGQDGPYVYVVKADGTVESRRVMTTRTIAGAAVIDKGLQVGETVVIDGQLRLVPGARVDIKSTPSEGVTVPTSNAAEGSGVLVGADRGTGRQDIQR